jgi:hypothetical protein
MKPLVFVISLTISTLLWGFNKYSQNQVAKPVIGNDDVSDKKTPSKESTDNILRIKTRLEYVEQLLRQKDVSHLPLALRNKREYVLDMLHAYRTSEVSPKHEPGNQAQLSALGYLIEKTAAKRVLEQINQKYQYEKSIAAGDQLINDWIVSNGLSKEECAMIQPTYKPTDFTKAKYTITSIAFEEPDQTLIKTICTDQK